MDTVFAKVAGLDVHKRTIACAVRCCQQSGKLLKESRSFGTMTRDLQALADDLQSLSVTHVALESTGVLWKPVWNILENRFTLLLVNPHHIKRVPGRKTDVTDAQWIAELLEHGMLRGSFVPPRAVRELRDLTRHRVQIIGEQTRAANRIHKVLEDANVKLGAVASDVLGVSGLAMLRALIQGGETPEAMAELARGKLRGKIPSLRLALEGRFTDHHRFLLSQLLGQIEFLNGEVARLTTRITSRLNELLSPERQVRLDAIPGVNRITIENVIAEIGPDMSVFPDEHHLSSWTGICPGNEESAGKRLRSKTRKGNPWLRRALTEAAWAASHTKDTYFSAQYRRLASRRGKQRALVALGHTLLGVMYFLLKSDDLEFHDLGADYFDRLDPERTRRYLVKRHLVKRLEHLGYNVNLEPKDSDDEAA